MQDYRDSLVAVELKVVAMWVEIDYMKDFVAYKEQKVEAKRAETDYKQNVEVGDKRAAVDWDRWDQLAHCE